jgi:hypothetical protein
MGEPNLIHSLFVLFAAFHAAPLLMLTAAMFFAWMYVGISDGSSPLMILLTIVLLAMFAIQGALLLAPRF